MTKSPTKVLYVVPSSRVFAGIQRVVHEIADELAMTYGDRLDIHVLFCSRHLEQTEYKPHYRQHFVEGARLRFLVPRLRKFFRENSYDVVIAAQCEVAVVVWLALRGSRAKFIPYLHGNPAIEEASSWNSRLTFFAYRALVGRRAASTLCVAPSLASYVRKNLPSGGPVHFVPNPIRAFSDTQRLSDPARPFTFLNVGRLSRQKAQDVLLDGFAIARARLPDSRLVVVGGGDELQLLRTRSQTLGLDACVEIVGEHVDPAPYFRAADCFVLSSRWEGFGLVLVEALSFGLPLVVTDCDFGPKDLVTDDRIGLVARSEDPDALADALVAIAAQKSGPEDDAYRKAQAAKFSRPAAARRHFEVLDAIFDGALARPAAAQVSAGVI